ncbi:hypothetical protein ABH926_010095 [Catenulispora sp. GP43]|uniref:DISARM system helicase DrmA n=1 Tax=Catenulispora sp. GP43 TaxID=3156263 RepID=UPI003517089C
MTQPAQQRQYQLASEPDGRSVTVRKNLVDILERELLGPANGPEEVLEGAPDVAYLIGRIAPFRLESPRTRTEAPSSADEPDAATDVGDALDAYEGRGVPMTAVDDSSPGSEDDEVEDSPQQRGLMMPASMGLRCQIADDVTAFTVTSSWGRYESFKEPDRAKGADGENEKTAAAGTRRYKRTPIEITTPIVIADLDPRQTTTIQLLDTVVLRVDRYDDPNNARKLIEIALCNDRVSPRKIPVDAWLYQAKLHVTADGEPAFVPVSDRLTDTRPERDDELRRLRLQYRDRLEFAVGRTCSVDWKVESPDDRRAVAVWTTWLPTAETPQTTAEEIGAALLDMRALAEASREELRAGLAPIVDEYTSWLDIQGARAEGLPDHLREDAAELVAEARRVQHQLAEGLDHLLSDDEALRCFRFMNRVMADQRVQTQVARMRANDPSLSYESARDKVLGQGPKAHSWFTFQLAFVLMQLPMLSDPSLPRRSGTDPKAQLLFFPTGGGKTEAYLGLAAYTFAIRRRQGIINTPDGPLDGGAGTAVLMRYTLRLLTAQQFQRATALVCAAELARLEDEATWGREPFRIGLWVGTDVSPKRFDEADQQLARANKSGGSSRLTVLQLNRCPWCGTPIGARDVKPIAENRRVFVYCGDDLAECPFAEGGTVSEGLPVLTVDEEIYRLAPAFLIATVDKFARLAREGEAASVFGHVARRCERHGFVHPDYPQCDIKVGNKHPAKSGLPAAAVRQSARLRPPDLIIQDELHLISGALGTTVGLFEVAVDAMAAWQDASGKPVLPLLVASTATARNAADQVKALYGRDITIFPPQVLDAGATFFSKEQPIDAGHPGRRYIGISTTGVRLTTAEIRIAEVLMAAGQLLLDRSGDAADPYMTLVGYFSATRELAGMARFLGDDVQTALRKRRPWSLLPGRTGTNFGSLHVAELTSRVSSSDITGTLDQMAVPFDVMYDSSSGKRQLAQDRAAGRKVKERDVAPFDAVLATSMLQVGVDVSRLGLMLVVGQPKNTAEYIQASSRVGRDAERPGLVVSLGNWARPRDLAHYEQFRHYHETFYAQVEALSVTPFSATSMDRGLDGVFVSSARVLQASRDDGLSPEAGAAKIGSERDFAVSLIDTLTERVLRASNEVAARSARNRLSNRLDQWEKRRAHLADRRKSLVYERVTDDTRFDALMMSAENARSRSGTRDAPPFVVANSMREVQPEINLLVSPIKDNLVYIAPPGAPRWTPPQENA